MKRVACIGKKETSPEEQNLLIKIGGWLALQGFTVSSGNAAGSERFFALGASMVNPAWWSCICPGRATTLSSSSVEPGDCGARHA